MANTWNDIVVASVEDPGTGLARPTIQEVADERGCAGVDAALSLLEENQGGYASSRSTNRKRTSAKSADPPANGHHHRWIVDGGEAAPPHLRNISPIPGPLRPPVALDDIQ